MIASMMLTGQTAVVIGAAAGGLGERAAIALSEAGAKVAVADLSSRAEDVAVTGSAANATVHEVDVTSEASVDSLFSEVVGRHGGVDVVVNAAGVMLRKSYSETSVEEFERVVRVNLTGAWLVGRAAGRVMTAAGTRGRLVHLSSVYADRVGPVPESAYYASKAGAANVTRALAAELGPHGITVNCLAPGVFYPTQMTDSLGEDPARLKWFADRTMLGRLGNPDTDFAGPLLLLASPASSYITGQVIYVDGGWSAW